MNPIIQESASQLCLAHTVISEGVKEEQVMRPRRTTAVLPDKAGGGSPGFGPGRGSLAKSHVIRRVIHSSIPKANTGCISDAGKGKQYMI